jgi:outer membrane protein assembly factor BamB/phospholipase C
MDEPVLGAQNRHVRRISLVQRRIRIGLGVLTLGLLTIVATVRPSGAAEAHRGGPAARVVTVIQSTSAVRSGTTVTIQGKGLSDTVGVRFGDRAARRFWVLSDRLVVARVPTLAHGDTSVTVVGASGRLRTASDIEVTASAPGMSYFPLSGPSGVVAISGSGWYPKESVELYLDSVDVDSLVADGTGAFTVKAHVPVTAAIGTHWLTAEGAVSGPLQGAVSVSTAWSMFRGSAAGTGLGPTESATDLTNVDSLALRWTATTGGAVRSSPASGLFYTFVGSDDGKLYVFPTNCGSPCSSRWTMATGGAIQAAPALVGSLAYVGSTDGKLYVFDPSRCATGGSCPPAWTGTTGGSITTSPVPAGRVFVGSSNGYVYAFPPTCGSSSCGATWSQFAGGRVMTTPAAGFGEVVVGTRNGFLTAMNVTNGNVLWQKWLATAVTGSPVLIQEPFGPPTVYAGTKGGKLYALNATTGALLWTGNVGAAVDSALAVAYGGVYFGADDGLLYAFSTIKCKSQPCQPMWTAATGGPVTSTPAVADGLVYAGSSDGKLYVYNARSGARMWSFSIGSPIESSPAVATGSVFVGADNGKLYAFRRSNAPSPPPKPSPSSLHPLSEPIRHVVIVFQENHSFDEVLGQLCIQDQRCNGVSSGQAADGTMIPLRQAPDLVPEVAHGIPDHVTAIDGGKMDGFSLLNGCQASTGYACYQQYQPSQIPNLAALARSFVISDRTFEGDGVPSWGAHIDLAAAWLDGFAGANPLPAPGLLPGPPTWGCDSNQTTAWNGPSGQIQVPSCIPRQDGSGPYAPSPVPWVPTIMDRLDRAGLSWRLYSGWGTWGICPSFADCAYGPQHAGVIPPNQVVTDAKGGGLPTLSVVIPLFGNSQHNSTSMLAGDNWIGQVVSAIESGPQWRSTAIFITWDDCGCFYDHVPPSQPGLGIREPMVIVSPYAKAGFTDSNVASFSSMLAYTEHVFGLAPLYTTDANAYDFSASFDYSQTPLRPVPLTQTTIPDWEKRWLREHPPDRNDPT